MIPSRRPPNPDGQTPVRSPSAPSPAEDPPSSPARPGGDRALLRRLGLRVLVVRTSRRLSQEHLAVAAGLDRTYVSRVERGAHNITVLTLTGLAAALDYPPGELLDSAVTDQPLSGLPIGRTRTGEHPPPATPPRPQAPPRLQAKGERSTAPNGRRSPNT